MFRHHSEAVFFFPKTAEGRNYTCHHIRFLEIKLLRRSFRAKKLCAGARRADCTAGEAKAAMRKLAAFAAGRNQRGGPGGASIPSECPGVFSMLSKPLSLTLLRAASCKTEASTPP